MKRTQQGNRVQMKAGPGEDLRNFDSEGLFVCNSEHPWSGKSEDAPYGVRHEAATQDENGRWWCEPCDSAWGG